MARHLIGSLVFLLLGTVAADVEVSSDSDVAEALEGIVAEAVADFAETAAGAFELAEALAALQDADQSASADVPPKISPELLAALAKLRPMPSGKSGIVDGPTADNPNAGPGFRIPKPLHSNAPHPVGPRNHKADEAVTKQVLEKLLTASFQKAKAKGGAGGAGGLDALMKMGKMSGNRGAGGKPAGGMPAGGAGAAAAGDASALLKALGKGAAAGTPGTPAGKNDFLKKQPKSSTEAGPSEGLEKFKESFTAEQQEKVKQAAMDMMGTAASQAAQAIVSGSAAAAASPLGDGAKALEEKLAKQMEASPADPAAVAQLEAAVGRQPTEETVAQLTKLKGFLETTVGDQQKFEGLRSLVKTPEGIQKLARFSEAAKEALGGFKSNGAMWGTTDQGFAAAARLVQAAEAMDGKEHEAFSATAALALKKYLQGHPDEARRSFKGMLSR